MEMSKIDDFELDENMIYQVFNDKSTGLYRIVSRVTDYKTWMPKWVYTKFSYPSHSDAIMKCKKLNAQC